MPYTPPSDAPPTESSEPTTTSHEGTAHHGPTPYSYDWWVHSNVFNIALVAVILFVVVQKTGLYTIFSSKRQSVADEINTVYAARDKAAAELKMMETRTANLNTEIESILAQAKSAAEDMSQKIVADAQAEAEAIVIRTQAQMAQEERQLLTQLQAKLMEESVAAAKDALGKLSASSQEASVFAFAKAIESEQLPMTTLVGGKHS
ncbi:MAG: ATP synthase F0 subunit B [Vampirovibrionales bacterium]|nr:ATP synthase F0 subunit B [Vampirovibrionales bacterium]